MGQPLWILGASDPKMAAIEDLLTESGQGYLYAAVDGVRCPSGNAYRADSTLATDGRVYRPIPGGVNPHSIVYVECEIPGLPRAPEQVIDHHRPGDPGFGAPPAEFMRAASIGQVVSRLAEAGRLPAEWPSGEIDPEDPEDDGTIWSHTDAAGITRWSVATLGGWYRDIPADIVASALRLSKSFQRRSPNDAFSNSR